MQKNSILLLTIIVSILCSSMLLLNNDVLHFTDARDGNTYKVVQINNLNWFQENLRYRPHAGRDTLIEPTECGAFYDIEAAQNACPAGWRLPTEKEVAQLIKLDKRHKINLADTLDIALCGRIDNENHTKAGEQNTFWLDAKMKDGHIAHWHIFKTEIKTHTHDVVNAKRQFPVRCVCEVEDK